MLISSQPDTRRSRISTNLIIFILLVFIAFIVAFRGKTRDTQIYVDIFYSTLNFPFDAFQYYSDFNVEFGFGIISWLVHSVGLSHFFFFFIYSFLTSYFLHKAALNFGLNLFEVLPFYLGNFFILQQLMQIRQGLASSIAFFVISLFIVSSPRYGRKLIFGVAAISTHVVSILPILSVVIIKFVRPCASRFRWFFNISLLIFLTYLSGKLFLDVQSITEVSKFDYYLSHQTFGSSRDLFDAANVRSFLLVCLFICSPKILFSNQKYALLVYLFSISFGIRIAFLDVAILSGRAASALSFAEVFILPLFFRAVLKRNSMFISVSFLYLLFNFYLTTKYQVPDIIEDYFIQ